MSRLIILVITLYSFSIFAQEVNEATHQLISTLDSRILQPSPTYVLSTISCRSKYLSSANHPSSVCYQLARSPRPISRTFSDGTVLLNSLAIDEMMERLSGRGLRATEADQRADDQIQFLIDHPNTTSVAHIRMNAMLDMLKVSLHQQITQNLPEDQLNDHQRFLLSLNGP